MRERTARRDRGVRGTRTAAGTRALDDGVYRSRVEVAGRSYDAMSNLGRNPSVGGTERRLETHIFGFTGELYGCRLRVELLQRIRGERKFASVEELRSRIEQDREEILKSING